MNYTLQETQYHCLSRRQTLLPVIFSPEDGNRTFLWNSDTCVLNYNASRHERSLSWYCCHLEFLRYMRIVTVFVGMIGCIVAHRCSTPWTHDAVEWGVRRPSVEGVLCCHFTPPWPKLTARTSSTSCDSSRCAQLHLSCKEGHGD